MLSVKTHSFPLSAVRVLFHLQAGGGPSGGVVGGETQAAGARRRAAAEILSGQRETAEGSGGPEEGTAAPYDVFTFSCLSKCIIFRELKY